MVSSDIVSSDILDNLLADVINRCRSVHTRSVLLSHSEFASENPRRLAKLIGGICSELVDHLSELREKFVDDPINIVNKVRIIDDFVREAGAQLRYVDGAIATKVPWSLPQPLEALTARLLPGTNLMLRPQWKYNYSILVSDLHSTYKEQISKILPEATVERLFSGFPTNFHIISFPSVERQTALLHCDLGHEIGHLVAKRFLSEEQTKHPYLIELQKRIAAQIEAESKDGHIPPLLKPQFIKERLEQAAIVRLRGLAEIVSDSFAMKLFGPAALFALFQIAIGDSLDLPPVESTSYYPPWRRRLRHALAALETADLLPDARKNDPFEVNTHVQEKVNHRIAEIRELTRRDSDKVVIAKNAIASLAYESIDEAIPHVDAFLNQEYGGSFMKRADLYAQVYPLVDRLRNKLPPNAIEKSALDSKAAALEAILNSAWFYRIAYLTEPFADGRVNEKFQHEYSTLNRLTLRAIEYSHIQQLFIEWNLEKETR